MQTIYHNLKVWQYAFDLTLSMYEVVALLPPCESHNIADQIRRASTSLPLNIAEGASCNSVKVYMNHLHYAYSSGQELGVLLMLCFKLNYINNDMFDKKHDELDKFLRSLYKFIVNKERKEAQNKLPFLKR
ncbi:four helix bundle protein [Candidatus Woesearchaeota archaeon]|nr:four helix bundle protein [Candidatus Woesearchaeota archaeon]